MDIKKILEDLYELDPALRSEEAELKKIIKKFAAQKPDAEYDEEFREKLKAELLKRVAEKKEEDKKRAGFFIVHRKAVVSAAGIAAAVIVALSFAVRPGFIADVMSPDHLTASEQAYEESYRGGEADSSGSTDEKTVAPDKETSFRTHCRIVLLIKIKKPKNSRPLKPRSYPLLNGRRLLRR